MMNMYSLSMINMFTMLVSCRTSEELLLYLGAKIGYWRGDIKGLVDDIGGLLNCAFCLLCCNRQATPFPLTCLAVWLALL